YGGEVTEQITCPWCKEDIQEGKSGSDNQPWKVEEIDKQFLLEEPSLWPERVCANHKEELKLYCVEDQTFICLVCRDAQNHKSHTLIPREEADASINQVVFSGASCLHFSLWARLPDWTTSPMMHPW
uniref:B box-type domain-containing protein n=1 Tax=Chrysemys picta bellii TaxID=8478 RepID=A0A8C3FCM0_CHRPI